MECVSTTNVAEFWSSVSWDATLFVPLWSDLQSEFKLRLSLTFDPREFRSPQGLGALAGSFEQNPLRL
jgi:hypothetical protein